MGWVRVLALLAPYPTHIHILILYKIKKPQVPSYIYHTFSKIPNPNLTLQHIHSHPASLPLTLNYSLLPPSCTLILTLNHQVSNSLLMPHILLPLCHHHSLNWVFLFILYPLCFLFLFSGFIFSFISKLIRFYVLYSCVCSWNQINNDFLKGMVRQGWGQRIPLFN